MLTKCLFFFLSDSHKIKSVLKERRQRHDKEDEHRYSLSKLSVDILVMHILLLANFFFCKVGQKHSFHTTFCSSCFSVEDVFILSPFLCLCKKKKKRNEEFI